MKPNFLLTDFSLGFRLEDRKSSTLFEEVDKPKDFSTSVSLHGYVTPWVSAKDIFIGYAKSAKKKKNSSL